MIHLCSPSLNLVLIWVRGGKLAMESIGSILECPEMIGTMMQSSDLPEAQKLRELKYCNRLLTPSMYSLATTY